MHKKHMGNRLVTIVLAFVITFGLLTAAPAQSLLHITTAAVATPVRISQTNTDCTHITKTGSVKSSRRTAKRKKNRITLKKKKLKVGTRRILIKNKGKTKMTCKSSNPRVVSVNNRGRLTAKTAGKAKITVKTKKTQYYRKCKKIFTVTVLPAPTAAPSPAGQQKPPKKPKPTASPAESYGHWETHHYGERDRMADEVDSTENYWEKVGYIVIDFQQQNFCNSCGANISSPDGAGIITHTCLSGYHLERVEIGRSEPIPGQTYRVWIADKAPHKGTWHDAQGHYELFLTSQGDKMPLGDAWFTGTKGSSDYIQHQKYFCYYIIDRPGYWE